jgi:hypothetical protein
MACQVSLSLVIVVDQTGEHSIPGRASVTSGDGPTSPINSDLSIASRACRDQSYDLFVAAGFQ